MNTESKKKKNKRKTYRELKDKPMGFKRFIASFKNSFDGLKYAYTHEQSLLIHVACSIIVVLFGFVFDITGTHWVLILFAMALIIVAELLNTAIEAVVDLVTEDYHPLAKVAKDCASAAVFIATIMATSIWLYVFIPKIIGLLL